MQMILVMFYAEDLKRKISNIDTRTVAQGRTERTTKKPVRDVLKTLVSVNAITSGEEKEIVGLINYRNLIAHELHNLLIDLSPTRIARDIITFAPELLRRYDYSALERLKHFHKRIGEVHRTHHYVMIVGFDRLLFESAEQTYLEEIKRLSGRIFRLTEIRRAEIEKLNAELTLENTELTGEWHPQHPLNQYSDGRLTERGVEICYRLFDMGKSAMAIAHLTGLSLFAIRKRQRMWVASGGVDRNRADLSTFPTYQL